MFRKQRSFFRTPGFGQDDQYGYLLSDAAYVDTGYVDTGVDIYSPLYDPATGTMSVPAQNITLASILGGMSYQTPSGAAALAASGQPATAQGGSIFTSDLLSTIVKTAGSVIQSVFGTGAPALTGQYYPGTNVPLQYYPGTTTVKPLSTVPSTASIIPSTIAGISTTYWLIGGAALLFLTMRRKGSGSSGRRSRRKHRRSR